MKRTDRIITWLIFVAVFGGLMVWASIYDLQISKNIAALKPGEYFSSNTFARAIEIFGETPLYCFLCFAFAVIFWNGFYFAKNGWKTTICVLAVLAAIACSLLVPIRIHKYFLRFKEELFDATEVNGGTAYVIFVLLVGASITMLSFAGAALAGKQKIRKLLAFAIVVLFVAAFSQLFTQGLKIINQRVRFRALNSMGSDEFFTPWYHLNGTDKFQTIIDLPGFGKDAVKSFPSGHTTVAGMTFTLLALPYLFDNLNDFWGKFILFFVSFAFTGMVAYSRILMGAHYLSDVVIGGGVSFLFSLIAIEILFVSKKIKPLTKYCNQEDEAE